MNSSWHQDNLEFIHSTIPKLKQIGLEVGKAALDGNTLAKLIMERYELLRCSFDPLTHLLLKEAIAEYDISRLRNNRD